MSVKDYADDPTAGLLKHYQATGDSGALDQLLRIEIEALKERIRRRYGHLLSPSAGASDVAQEAAAGFARVARRTHFENPIALRAYLLRAATRLLARHTARRSRRPLATRDEAEDAANVAATGPSTFSFAEQRDRAGTLRLVLATLPDDQREILELVYLREMPVKDAAERVGIAVEAAFKRVQRGRVALAERLAAWTRVLE